MKTYDKINNLFGWLCAILTTVVYIITADRFTSWWDTGEFIASAYRLQIVHQPGAPLFLMIQNIFSNFALGDVSKIAYWMNIGSAVCSGLTILFLFWTITALTRKILIGRGGTPTNWMVIQIMLAGVIGALAYGFTDTFWYSAVESEVYAMSSLCTAVVFWLILKWERRAEEPDANRWLILIAYIMGLSIGVHLLNLLTIPAIALVVYFKKNQQITWKGMVKALTIGITVLALILWGLIQYSIRIAATFDVFFVNQLGLGFGSGIVFFFLLLVGGLVWGIRYSVLQGRPILNISLLSLSFICFGYLSYAMIAIRAHADPALNNNSPDNVYAFLGYLNREQYGKEPLLRGQTFDAQVTGIKPTETYKKGTTKYEKIEGISQYTYSNEMLFPRLYSEKHADYYRSYLGLAPNENPTFSDNLNFFFKYQLGNMYSRYFFWNFVGRQNDEQNYGGYSEGNWISGLKTIDSRLVGGQTDLPESMYTNPSRNVYYFLPLFIGVIGLIWHFRKDKRFASIVALLFFFTGAAIVIYLNQTPIQPRERDYAYAGSFYAFSIWIGLGVLGLADFMNRKVSLRASVMTSGLVCLLAAPVLLISENWDDHDRSDRSLARDMAYNYLASCKPNAILFTYADNDTFPLWYLQEVEGIRTDVRIVNLSYLQSHWYVRQLSNQVNDAAPVRLNFDTAKLAEGVRDYMPFVDQGIENYVHLDTLLEFLLSDNPTNQVQTQNGKMLSYLPAKKIEMAVDKQAVINHQVVPSKWSEYVVDKMKWDYPQNHVSRAELSLMSIVLTNNWERPIYFTNYTPTNLMAGLDKYIVDEGIVRKLMPVELPKQQEGQLMANMEKLYENATQNFRWGKYGSMNFVDVDSRRMMENFIYPDVYAQTTQLLKQQGDMERAKAVAVKAVDILPKRTYSLNEALTYTDIVDTLYKTEEIELANRVVKRNVSLVKDYLDYSESLVRDKPDALDVRKIRFSLAALEMYDAILEGTNERELYAQVNKTFTYYRDKYISE
ncbi:glycosyltransferase family 117 protein [Sphingobacterium chuzhouense]|uniref:DUF2723 domain-containing protein n=1 Tax=Sphingobacterium chuzhouense TaxID=1742264 RepID=A0ABR7XML6_9SPHI|nr:DUF2723 domain-containing protein [Sphingobacterium chuzhouense]MBD1420415.1 DUF2723 domain-containing protein [Sphingobacterium chuzhouense]